MARPAEDDRISRREFDPRRLWGSTLSTQGVVAYEMPLAPRPAGRFPPAPPVPRRACWHLAPIRSVG